MIKRICIITDGFPSEYRIVNTFVDKLACEFVDLDVECTVISPQSISKAIKSRHKILPKYRERITQKGNVIKVFSPKYISASIMTIGRFNSGEITLNNFKNAVESIFKQEHMINKFDAVYGHFIFESGIVANYLGDKYDIPSFFAYGENTEYSIEYLGKCRTRELLKSINGVISVSTQNKNVLIDNEIVNKDIIGVFPNSIDSNIFYPRDKSKMREKFNFSSEDFIIAFIGRFVEVKGANRLSEAITRLDNKRIKSIFIGSGNVIPNCEGILYQGSVKHDKIPEILSAADIFVLPTQAEGCCNAIVEAMACGLPIVSSKKPFNDDILDKSCSIRVDENNVEEIALAINELYNDLNLRKKLSLGALRKSQMLNITERAKNILDFMNNRIGDREYDTE